MSEQATSATDSQARPHFWTLANIFTFARVGLAPVCAFFYLLQTH